MFIIRVTLATRLNNFWVASKKWRVPLTIFREDAKRYATLHGARKGVQAAQRRGYTNVQIEDLKP